MIQHVQYNSPDEQNSTITTTTTNTAATITAIMNDYVENKIICTWLFKPMVKLLQQQR